MLTLYMLSPFWADPIGVSVGVLWKLDDLRGMT